jgi:hypothetical protein
LSTPVSWPNIEMERTKTVKRIGGFIFPRHRDLRTETTPRFREVYIIAVREVVTNRMAWFRVWRQHLPLSGRIVG